MYIKLGTKSFAIKHLRLVEMSPASGDEIEDAFTDLPGGDANALPFDSFSKSERIQQLNDIDKVCILSRALAILYLPKQSITKLLRSAGLAIKTLTAYQTFTEPTGETLPRDELQNFTEASSTYLNSLHSVDVRLKRQIHGLVESGIIVRDKEAGMRKPDVSEAAKVAGDRNVSSLDVGWLNSRSDKVDKVMEAELWQTSREFLEDVIKEKNSDHGDKIDESMDEVMGF